MSDKTGIQWTDATWNPVSGCSKVSPGCKNCYAERDWARLLRNPKLKNYFGRPFTEVRRHPERLEQPLRWKKPRKIFVNSMSDLFHEDVPDQFIDEVFAIMAISPHHTFQILTKRSERMREWMWAFRRKQTAGEKLLEALPEEVLADGPKSAQIEKDLRHLIWPLPNIHLGVSVENQATDDERIPILLRTPAAVRFLSVEPLLGQIDLHLISGLWPRGANGFPAVGRPDWIIIGGESGPGARPCNIEWIRSILNYSRAARVPVFVKQLGARPHLPGATPQTENWLWHLRHHKGGDPAEWPEDLRVREFPR